MENRPDIPPATIITVPRRTRGLLLASIAYLGIVTAWVGPEDSIWAATVLGAAGAVLAVLNLVTLRLGGRRVGQTRFLLLAALGGGVAGLGASGITALLMTIKTAVHAHGTHTDYPAHVVLGIASRAPLWGVVGLLVGIAVGLATLALAGRETESSANPP